MPPGVSDVGHRHFGRRGTAPPRRNSTQHLSTEAAIRRHAPPRQAQSDGLT